MDFIGIMVLAGIVITLFLIFREFVCWYWKLNQCVELLTEIRNLLAAKSKGAP
jgi:hypothetical protein